MDIVDAPGPAFLQETIQETLERAHRQIRFRRADFGQSEAVFTDESDFVRGAALPFDLLFHLLERRRRPKNQVAFRPGSLPCFLEGGPGIDPE